MDGGNNRVVADGDPVIQPGLIDVGCDMSSATVVATIAWANNPTLPNYNIDAGIAQIIPGMVKDDGSILEIGTLSSSTVAAYIGQAVKKSGRTTGLTRSSVSGLNSTVSITYDDECAGATAFTKTFTGQIIIENRRSAFLDSGDSGSLMVDIPISEFWFKQLLRLVVPHLAPPIIIKSGSLIFLSVELLLPFGIVIFPISNQR